MHVKYNEDLPGPTKQYKAIKVKQSLAKSIITTTLLSMYSRDIQKTANTQNIQLHKVKNIFIIHFALIILLNKIQISLRFDNYV